MRARIHIVAMAAVAVTWEHSATGQDSARIYVYAQRLTHARSWLSISCGGAVAAQLKRGTFFAINVAPGHYTLSTESGLPAFVDVRSGEEAFVRLDWNIGIDRPAIAALDRVPADQARREMKYLS